MLLLQRCRNFDVCFKKSAHCRIAVSLNLPESYSISHSITHIRIMSNDLASKVKAIIVEKLGVDEDDITNDASFTNDLGADSLDTVELIMEFEKEFDVTIPDEDAEKIATVGDAVTYLQGQLD